MLKQCQNKSLVGPAGLIATRKLNDLATIETERVRDVPPYLSQTIISEDRPVPPFNRKGAAMAGDPDSKVDKRTLNIIESSLHRQASRLMRLYSFTYKTASTIATLAYGAVR